MQQDEKQNVSRETLEGSVDMLDIARVAQDVEASLPEWVRSSWLPRQR